MKHLWIALIVMLSLAAADCVVSLTTGASTCAAVNTTSVTHIEETNYENSQTHSVIIKTRINVISPEALFTKATETKTYKMNGTYVSERICSAYPGGCKNDPDVKIVQSGIQQNPTIYLANHSSVPVKGISQCTAARDQDWQTYIGMMYAEKTPIAPDANPVEKNNILNMLAGQHGSAQYKCLYGIQ